MPRSPRASRWRLDRLRRRLGVTSPTLADPDRIDVRRGDRPYERVVSTTTHPSSTPAGEVVRLAQEQDHVEDAPHPETDRR